MRRAIIALALIGAVSPGAVTAQDGFLATIEMMAHERLMTVMQANDPTPFVTDGCSGGLSVGWSFAAEILPGFADLHGNRPPWEDCCFAHDRAYHDPPADTAKGSFDARLAADQTLRACVRASAPAQTEALENAYGLSHEGVASVYGAIAATMYDAVRLGGGPCSILPWRWGFGYPLCPLVQ